MKVIPLMDAKQRKSLACGIVTGSWCNLSKRVAYPLAAEGK